MNRLTDRSKEIQLPCTGNGVFWARVHEKLARYEDTELNPEECAKYAQAEKEGRLLVLPARWGTNYGLRKTGKFNAKPFIEYLSMTGAPDPRGRGEGAGGDGQ